MNQTISVCIISGAEAHRLDTCLASVDGLADEVIVVVDDRANDGTADVACRRGAKVFTEKWKGHIGQKNSAADHVRSDGLRVLPVNASATAWAKACSALAGQSFAPSSSSTWSVVAPEHKRLYDNVLAAEMG